MTLYNAEEKGFSHHYRGDVAPVDQVSYSYDGNLVAFLVRGSPYITLFDTRTNETFRSWRISQNRVTALAFAPNSLNLAVASESAVTIWNGQTGELRETFVWAGGARCLTYSHDGRFLVGGGADGTVRLWALRDGNRERVLNAHSGAVLSLCFLAGRDVVASGGADRDIHLFDANTGNLLNTLIEHDDAVTALIGTPDGNTLVSGGLDERIRIWDAKTGKLQRTILFFTPVASLATFPDGKRFVAAGFRDSLTVWDIATGQIVRRL